MALPIVHALPECASYSKAIEPCFDQLHALCGDFADAAAASWASVVSGAPGAALQPFARLYTATNPLVSGFAVSLALGVVFFVVSEYNRNYSQVDRCWSLLPTLYIGHFGLWARLNGIATAKLDAALLFGVAWSARLTFNYARKGGYNVGSEDYRWNIVQKAIPAWSFCLLNLTFISFIQSVLLYAIAAPAYALLLASTLEPRLTAVDVAFTAMELGLVVVEWFADQQQWDYQAAKQKYRATGRVPAGFTQAALDRGFLVDGLWAYSRHPNFAAEQSVWFTLFQWSCVASGVPYSWFGAGAGALLALFQGSTWLTEMITAGKYPEYKAYQQQVNMFVPTTSLAGYRPTQPKIIRTSELAQKKKN